MRFMMMAGLLVLAVGCESQQMRQDRRLYERMVAPVTLPQGGVIEIFVLTERDDCFVRGHSWRRTLLPGEVTDWSSHQMEIQDGWNMFQFVGYEQVRTSNGNGDAASSTLALRSVHTRMRRCRPISAPFSGLRNLFF
jgi:hypothetical protein